mgnify:CR=1 FL=1
MNKEYRLTAQIVKGTLLITKDDGSDFEILSTPANGGAFPVFGYGTHSPAVAVVQALLNYYGAEIAVDGQYGLATRSALFDFKSAHGLEVNAQVSRETWAALLKG